MRTLFIPEHPTPARPDPLTSRVVLELGDYKIWGGGVQPHTDGSRWWWTALDGWWDLPSTTGGVTQFLQADGGWWGRSYWTPRVIEITGSMDAPSRPEARDAVEAFLAQIPAKETMPLVVHEDGLVRYAMVRMSGDPDVTWADGSDPYIEWNIQLTAADPRRMAGVGPDDGWRVYGPTALPSSTGGWTFPLALPAPINAVSNTGEFSVTSLGTGPAMVQVEFRGPVSEPSVTDRETGKKLWFELNLQKGDVLTVDLSTGATARQVLLNGVSRRGKARGEWFTVTGNQTIQFGASSYNPDASMTVNVKDVWL